MADDKHIIAVLLDALEDAHVTRIMLITMIMTYRDHYPQIGDWERDLETLKAQHGATAKKQFLALREAVRRSSDVERALAQFLKDTPPKGPVH
jgi:hypothetical protein